MPWAEAAAKWPPDSPTRRGRQVPSHQIRPREVGQKGTCAGASSLPAFPRLDARTALRVLSQVQLTVLLERPPKRYQLEEGPGCPSRERQVREATLVPPDQARDNAIGAGPSRDLPKLQTRGVRRCDETVVKSLHFGVTCSPGAAQGNGRELLLFPTEVFFTPDYADVQSRQK